MGDRSNVFFRSGTIGVGVYAHWGGLAMAQAVADVISRPAFKKRVGDASYATRIGVQGVLELLGADPNEETGFGIWTPAGGLPDNEYPYVVVDVENGAVYVSDDYSDKDDAHRIDPPTARAIAEAMESE